MLDRYEYEKLAEEVSNDFINKGQPLNVSIKIISIQRHMNPEQIKRLTEASNIKTYNKLYDNNEDKTFKFEVGDSKKIIDDVYAAKPVSDVPESKEKEVEFKESQPVEFGDKLDKGRLERTEEILGDDDEAEVSKNVMHRDSAGDTMEDALKIPEKNYGDPIVNAIDEKNEAKSEGKNVDSETKDREDVEKKEEKEASLKEVDATKLAALKVELDNRIEVKANEVMDEYNKVSYLFKKASMRDSFAEFEKNASLIYNEVPCIQTMIQGIAKLAYVKASEKIEPIKIANYDAYGISELGNLVKVANELSDLYAAREYIENNTDLDILK